MGLDAVVFRNARRLEDDVGEGLFDVDAVTGEATPRPDVVVALPRGAYYAAKERL
jgi:hypothetical protein